MTTRLPLTVLTTIDPVLRDAATMGLLTDSPGTVVLRHDILDDPSGGELRRVVMDGSGVVEDVRVPLEHACLSCAVREDALPVLRELAASGRWDSVALALPVSAESLPVTRALATETRRGGMLTRLRLAAVTLAVGLDTVVEDLLGDDLLDDRGLALTEDDRRAVGEALAAQLAHADVVVTAGTAPTPAASDLVDHLRAGDSQRIDDVHTLDVATLLDTTHDPRRGEDRLDPLRATAHTHDSTSGVWSVELRSTRPFHPERLVDEVERLGGGRLRSRGVFWVANRPDSVCMWDGAGAQISVGEIDTWGRRPQETRLVVTGVDDDLARVQDAFETALLTDAEMRQGLGAWLDRDDALEPWLGARSMGG